MRATVWEALSRMLLRAGSQRRSGWRSLSELAATDEGQKKDSTRLVPCSFNFRRMFMLRKQFRKVAGMSLGGRWTFGNSRAEKWYDWMKKVYM